MVFLGERKERSRFLPRSLWLNSLGAIYLKPPSLLHRRLDRRPTKEKRACSIGRFSPRPCQPVIIDVYNSLFFFVSLEGGGSVHEVPQEYRNNVGVGDGRAGGSIGRKSLGWRSERFTFARNDLGGIKFYESSAIAVTTSPSSTFRPRVIAL